MLSRSAHSFIAAYAPEAVIQPTGAGAPETAVDSTRVLFPRFEDLAPTVIGLVDGSASA
jgi:hypothetical protein